MNKFALIGYPLGHSMSPFIHKKLFEKSGREADYSLVEIAPENMKQEFPKVFEKFEGLNVTIPHKINVIEYMDSLDESAGRYNSVNCVCRKDGKLIGFNTDCDGFLRTVPSEALSGKVLLLGCGGVGRMMAIEIARHGGNLTIAIIPEASDMAEKLKNEILESFPETEISIININDAEGEFDLLANATPVGMYPKLNACPVSEKVIENCKFVFDVIYNPARTKLISIAEKLNIPAVGGMSMLVYQAVAAHEIWDGDSYTKEQIDSIIKEATEIVNKDFK